METSQNRIIDERRPDLLQAIRRHSFRRSLLQLRLLATSGLVVARSLRSAFCVVALRMTSVAATGVALRAQARWLADVFVELLCSLQSATSGASLLAHRRRRHLGLFQIVASVTALAPRLQSRGVACVLGKFDGGLPASAAGALLQ